jgi:hypothetical protein
MRVAATPAALIIKAKLEAVEAKVTVGLRVHARV